MKPNRNQRKILLDYVVVAILVIAAVLFAVSYFGRAAMNACGVAGSAMSGSCEQARAAKAERETKAANDAESRRESAQSAEKWSMMSGKSRGDSGSIDIAELDAGKLDDDDGRGRPRSAGK